VIHTIQIPDLPDLLDINPWIMDYKEAIGTSDQILDCQWVIMNTTSKHGKLLRHKARPETLGNQQHDCGLPTRATALAMTLPTRYPWIASVTTRRAGKSEFRLLGIVITQRSHIFER